MCMKKTFPAAVVLLLPFATAHANEPPAYEMPRTHVLPIKDSATDRQYELYVKLPENYGESVDVSHPVIYTTDAAWHMDMLSGATEYLMPDAIVVGISWEKSLDPEREYASRFRDYTVAEYSDPERQARFQGGQASNHLQFIRNEVIGYVEENYQADPGERTYFGYSLGGAFGAYILLAKPNTFERYILGSPAIGPSRVEYMDNLEAETVDEASNLRVDVFVTIGELEQSKMGITEDFVSVLKRRADKGWAVTGPLVIEDADHAGAFPMTTVRAVKWLSELTEEQGAPGSD